MSAITKLAARPILDSRGEWTIEVEMILKSGRRSTVSVPQGKSVGSHEAAVVSPARAIKNIEKIIFPKLKGKNPFEQRKIDELLIKLDGTRNKHRLGGNALIGVSLAAAKAAAFQKNIPLWRHFRNLSGLVLPEKQSGEIRPRLYMNLINGGAHAANNLDFQEYLVIPRAPTFRESISIGRRVYYALREYLAKKKNALSVGDEGGLAPSFRDNIEPFRVLKRMVRLLHLEGRVDFGLDAAATGIHLKNDKLKSIYRNLIHNYHLLYLEDPFSEEDFLEFRLLRSILGDKVLIAGDDLTATNVFRMEKARAAESINAVIIKPNQIGTVSEALDAVRLAKEYGWALVVSHRSGETNDDFIADFAYGVVADGIKLGAPTRGERIAKYNRLLSIENDTIKTKGRKLN